MTTPKMLTLAGLTLDISGVIVLLRYAVQTDGCTTRVDRSFRAPSWLERMGYGLLLLGFAFQAAGTWLG